MHKDTSSLLQSYNTIENYRFSDFAQREAKRCFGKKKVPFLRYLNWYCKYLFFVSRIKSFQSRKHRILKIGFILGGGLGDTLISILYIKKFCEKLDINYSLSIFSNQNVDDVNILIKKQFTADVYSISSYKKVPLDLLVRISFRFPEILYFNFNKIRKSIFLKKYVVSIANFMEKYSDILSFENGFNQIIFAKIMCRTRITMLDIDDLLDLQHNDVLNDIAFKDEEAILKKYTLLNTEYITLARSLNIKDKHTLSNTRLWPLDNYDKLASLIKKENPKIKIIQLGGFLSNENNLKNVDLNLSGKTTFKELLVILKHSKLHIDGECGMVHLRHFLCRKKSVVLFGPTDKSYAGYPENLNLSCSNCTFPCCEWLIGKNWQTSCIKTNSSIPACMVVLSPDFVFKKLKEFL